MNFSWRTNLRPRLSRVVSSRLAGDKWPQATQIRLNLALNRPFPRFGDVTFRRSGAGMTPLLRAGPCLNQTTKRTSKRGSTSTQRFSRKKGKK